MIKDYRNYLKIERAMSPNTVASYCSDVEKFLESLVITDKKDIKGYNAKDIETKKGASLRCRRRDLVLVGVQRYDRELERG